MQLTKKILLALVFSFSFSFTIFYFVESILNTVKPTWYQDNDALSDIFWWIFFVLFFFSSLSSILWLANKVNRFWFLKIPALFILPFSIPYLILDYLELKRKNEMVEKIQIKNKKDIQLIFLVIVGIFNFFFNSFSGQFFFANGYCIFKLLLIFIVYSFNHFFWFSFLNFRLFLS